MSLTTEINIAGKFPDQQAIERELQSKQLLGVIGNAISGVLVRHFEELNAERHHGYSSFGFYEMAARSTGFTEEYGFPAVVVMKQGVSLRRFGTAMLPGGMLKAKNVTYLAIPNSFSGVIGAVYGRSPKEFDNLKVVFGHQKDTGEIGPIALKADDGDGGGAREKRSGKAVRYQNDPQSVPYLRGKKTRSSYGEILFWLRREVYQAADASVLPTQEELENAGYEAATQFLTHLSPTNITILN